MRRACEKSFHQMFDPFRFEFMANTATFSFANEPELGNKGMVISVKRDNDILGHLMIGKASLVWFDKSKKKKGHKVSWEELEAWFKIKPESDETRP